MKTTELPALMKTKDISWDSTHLAMWSGIELSVGILIASLPSLRKQFEALFHKTVSSTFLNSRSKTRSTGGNSLPLYDVAAHHTIGSRASRVQSRYHGEPDDADSERSILGSRNTKDGITKTVVHEVRSDDRSSLGALDQEQR